MRFKRHIELEKGKLDLTPLVDVVLLLLIFFMLTSSFIVQPTIPVKLPKALTGKSLEKRRFEIVITSENIIYIEGAPITVKKLEEKLQYFKKKGKLSGVLIKSDRKTSLGTVVQVWDICRKLDITQIDLATNSSKSYN